MVPDRISMRQAFHSWQCYHVHERGFAIIHNFDGGHAIATKHGCVITTKYKHVITMALNTGAKARSSECYP